jgi:hypothetical protein
MGVRLALALFASSLLAYDAGCGTSAVGGCGFVNGPQSATFDTRCSPNDLTSVVATGPCAIPDAGVSWYVGKEGTVSVLSPSPGVCHIELIFATGFTYSADVTFNSQEGECASSNVPILGPFMVDNPIDTCVALDAGADE